MQTETTFTTSVRIGHQSATVTVIALPMNGRIGVMWAEMNHQPTPAWVWDMIEADIDAGGPCRLAYDSARQSVSDKPLQAYVADSAAQEERDRLAVRWDGFLKGKEAV